MRMLIKSAAIHSRLHYSLLRKVRPLAQGGQVVGHRQCVPILKRLGPGSFPHDFASSWHPTHLWNLLRTVLGHCPEIITLACLPPTVSNYNVLTRNYLPSN